MPNRKADANNRCGFSTDFIGANWAWPEASYEERERILKAHLDYQRGLMRTLANLFVPVCLSASHMAFGSIRMEPVFFALGQVSGTAAVQAIDAGCAVQDLPYAPLAARLDADGMVRSLAGRR